MRIPTNPIAETIQMLNEQNESHTLQIQALSSLLAKNNATITELTPLATWEDVPDEDTPVL